MDQDIVSGLYDFPAREYNALEGRWPSPDPAGLASVNPADPQTWNRYAYVRDSPLMMTDPTGMDPCPPGAPAGAICVTTTGFLPGGVDGTMPVNFNPAWCNPYYLSGCLTWNYPGANPPGLPPIVGYGGGGSPCQYMLQNPCGSGSNSSSGTCTGSGCPTVTGQQPQTQTNSPDDSCEYCFILGMAGNLAYNNLRVAASTMGAVDALWAVAPYIPSALGWFIRNPFGSAQCAAGAISATQGPGPVGITGPGGAACGGAVKVSQWLWGNIAGRNP